MRGPEHPGQFRLTRIQLVNWGTFEGYRDITVPRKGVLITGASGSGKSSLLDAIAAIMVQPRWLAFNAAAQQSGQGDRSRDILSYVRGAHRRDVDESTGQVTTTYLRTGATWSGIALTFDDADGRTVSLLRLMHATQQALQPRRCQQPVRRRRSEGRSSVPETAGGERHRLARHQGGPPGMVDEQAVQRLRQQTPAQARPGIRPGPAAPP